MEKIADLALFPPTFCAMVDNNGTLATRFSESDWKAVVLSGGLTQYTPRNSSVA